MPLVLSMEVETCLKVEARKYKSENSKDKVNPKNQNDLIIFPCVPKRKDLNCEFENGMQRIDCLPVYMSERY